MKKTQLAQSTGAQQRVKLKTVDGDAFLEQIVRLVVSNKNLRTGATASVTLRHKFDKSSVSENSPALLNLGHGSKNDANTSLDQLYCKE